MHTVAELETNVPAFLGKLWKLVDDAETDDLIYWAPNGRSFFIRNTARFARDLLPHYYKHNNMASFVRQLNMYGFHKKVSVDVGGLKCDRDEMEFAHQYFIKDHPYLLEHIKRKIASTKTQEGTPSMKSEVMSKVLNEVRSMRGRQEYLDTRLGAMKKENEALWRELAMLRRKHLKQQEIVNKLIHFLVTLVQPSRSASRPVKRRYPLMIDGHQRDKQMKMQKPETSPTGPVIHELDPSEHEQIEHELDSQYMVAEMLDNQHPAVQSPQSINDALEDESTGTLNYVSENSLLNNEIRLLETQGKSAQNTVHKMKKKGRKNKVPIKILIPPTESGEEAREEMLMLEIGQDDSENNASLLANKSTAQRPKQVPVKTVRSSKLAAMARNINKMKELETDMDSDDAEDDPEPLPDTSAVDLDDILIIPDVLTNDHENPTNGNDIDTSENIQETNESIVNDANNETGSVGDANSSAQSKDWSLSCVNLPNTANNTSYRLGSTDEVGNHVVSLQNDLDQLRDTLVNEGYSLDVNTLFELFSNDDLMFGTPTDHQVQLNPTHEVDDEDHLDALNNGTAGGELMTYNPSTSLLDFDNDILLDTNDLESDGKNANDNFDIDPYDEDPLDLVDSKAKLLESLVSEAKHNESTNS